MVLLWWTWKTQQQQICLVIFVFLPKWAAMWSNVKYDWNKQQQNRMRHLFFSPSLYVHLYFHISIRYGGGWGRRGDLITAMDSRLENLIQAALWDCFMWARSLRQVVCLFVVVIVPVPKERHRMTGGPQVWFCGDRAPVSVKMCSITFSCLPVPSDPAVIWVREWTGCLTGDVQQCPKFLIPNVLSMIAAQCGSTQVISSHVLSCHKQYTTCTHFLKGHLICHTVSSRLKYPNQRFHWLAVILVQASFMVPRGWLMLTFLRRKCDSNWVVLFYPTFRTCTTCLFQLWSLTC